MNLRQIEYFIKVAEAGSFTRASVLLGIPQPSLSRQVRLLEDELQETLLRRHGRGVELTPAGACFLEHGQVVVHSLQAALQALADSRGDQRGQVAVGLPSRVARTLSASLVADFHRRFPRAVITVSEGTSSVLCEWLLLGRVNVALLLDPPRSGDMELELLHTEELVLVGPSAHRGARASKTLSLEDLPSYPLILPRVPNATRSVLEAAVGKRGIHLDVVTEADTVQSILELVTARLGYALLPHGSVKKDGEKFSVMHFGPPGLHQGIFMATSKRQRRGVLVGEIERLLRSFDLPKLLG